MLKRDLGPRALVRTRVDERAWASCCPTYQRSGMPKDFLVALISNGVAPERRTILSLEIGGPSSIGATMRSRCRCSRAPDGGAARRARRSSSLGGRRGEEARAAASALLQRDPGGPSACCATSVEVGAGEIGRLASSVSAMCSVERSADMPRPAQPGLRVGIRERLEARSKASSRSKMN